MTTNKTYQVYLKDDDCTETWDEAKLIHDTVLSADRADKWLHFIQSGGIDKFGYENDSIRVLNQDGVVI